MVGVPTVSMLLVRYVSLRCLCYLCLLYVYMYVYVCCLVWYSSLLFAAVDDFFCGKSRMHVLIILVQSGLVADLKLLWPKLFSQLRSRQVSDLLTSYQVFLKSLDGDWSTISVSIPYFFIRRSEQFVSPFMLSIHSWKYVSMPQ